MASFVYNSAVDDGLRGSIDYDTDTFYQMLVTSGYSANKDTHTKRSDLSSEVANGNGYTTGGKAVVCTVSKDTATDNVTLSFASTSWESSTITAAGSVVYKRRGGAASADELIFFNDFGGNVSSSNATFTVGSSVIKYQN